MMDFNILGDFTLHIGKDAPNNEEGRRIFDFQGGYTAGYNSIPQDVRILQERIVELEAELSSHAYEVLVPLDRYEELIETEAMYKGLCK
jgi:hypothetical protein